MPVEWFLQDIRDWNAGSIAALSGPWTLVLGAHHLLPGAIFAGPRKGQLADLARLRELGQLLQRRGQHLPVLIGIGRPPKGASNREIDKTARGATACSMMSRTVPIMRVGMPRASMPFATRLTVSWQNGQ
jgi:hypothetical protein